MRSKLALPLAVLLFCGCGAASTAGVKVSGPQSAIMQFAGDWEGEYEGEDTANMGTLRFSIDPGQAMGRGDVTVTTGLGKQVVTIEKFAVDETNLHGQLASYIDTGCQCEVLTKFVGRRDGVVLVGTWTTQPVGTERVFTGRWRASQKQP